MKKRRKSSPNSALISNNPVAKYAHQFNKAQAFKDKRKYQRKAKHKGLEPLSIKSFIDKGFNAYLPALHESMVY